MFKHLFAFLFLLLSCFLAPSSVVAQYTVGLCTWRLANGVLACTQVSTINPLPVTGTPGVVSAANSTTAPLDGGATFTGTGTSILGYGFINIEVYSDASSAASGVQIQWSMDNTNWDDSTVYTFTSGSPAPNAGQSYGAGVRGQYMRVVYVNGAGAQGTFRLTTTLHPYSGSGDIVDESVPLNGNSHGLVTDSSMRRWGGANIGAATAWGVAPTGNMPGVNANIVAGNVGGYEFQIAPTITVQNAAYAAGNSMGGMITATGAARTNGGGGILAGLRLKSVGGATNTVWIYGWSKTPLATCTDKAAYVANAGDQPYALVGFPMQITLGNSPGSWDTATYANMTNLVNNFKNQDASPGTALYFCIVTAAAVTPATTADLSMVLGGIQD